MGVMLPPLDEPSARAVEAVAAIHALDTVVAPAAGEGAVWASKDDAAGVARIDPATNQVTGTIPTHPEDSPPLVAA